MGKWRCTVCRYGHSGKEVPERCPRCGAVKHRFVIVGAGSL
ncbi:MAG: rubredoxin-like domain-containing protein [Candidatus Bathyarchaeia archaeon]